MRIKLNKHMLIISLLSLSLVLVACGDESPGRASGSQELGSTGEQSGELAIVEVVAVEEAMGHKYAVVHGNYPDSCTKISKVEQVVEGNSFIITLFSDRPDDLMCAQMISAFAVNILLEVGGQAPGEYSVNVNDSASTTFNIGG